MQSHPTTPFGRRSLSLAMLASQANARDFASSSGAPDVVVHKWRLFRALTEAKVPLGVTDRALSVLHALLSFHQETALSLPAGDQRSDDQAEEARAGIVVFPSNRELSIRAHGMASATLRRHLACLVEAGLIIRRDSPNGKRYARRGQGGEIESAFGFDLTPLVARAAEIENLAEEVRAENKAIRLLRERITLLRRDIVKMIATGIEENIPGDWGELHLRYAALSGRFGRNLSRVDLEALARDLAVLNAEIQNSLENHLNLQKKNANESHSERHIQNQITDSLDLEPSLREGRGETLQSNDQGSASPSINANAKPSAPRTYPLGMVLNACPDIVDYAKGGINNWRDLATTAALVRSALGVSPDAWAQALEAMGEHDASIVIAAILQRADEIKSAGGYLRVLTAKARAGEFSLGPVLMALLRGKAAKSARERQAVG